MGDQDNASPSASVSTEGQSVTLNLNQAVALCAAALLVCFFLPWINVLVAVSGFHLAKEGGLHLLFWLVPIFSALTILAVITKRSPKIAAQLTGALPFAALAYGYSKLGKDIFQIIALGGYLSLGLGLILFILPRRLK